MNYGVIYLLINKINNKMYIGQTVNFNGRMAVHKKLQRKDKLHNAINKYGWDVFEKIIIDIAYSKEELDILEIFYIEKFNTLEFGYNLELGGISSGKKSEYTRNKISQKAKSRDNSLLIERMKNIAINKRTKIICNETGQIFNSQLEASRILNISLGNLNSHLYGYRKMVNKLTFKFYA